MGKIKELVTELDDANRLIEILQKENEKLKLVVEEQRTKINELLEREVKEKG